MKYDCNRLAGGSRRIELRLIERYFGKRAHSSRTV